MMQKRMKINKYALSHTDALEKKKAEQSCSLLDGTELLQYKTELFFSVVQQDLVGNHNFSKGQ